MGARRLPDGRVAVLLSAHAEELVEADARAIADYLDRFPATTVTQVAAQLSRTRRVRRHRAVLRAADRPELLDALRALAARLDHPLVARSALATPARQAFVFPGQGSQRPGMGADFDELPPYRAAVERCAAALHAAGAPSPLRYLLAAGEHDQAFSGMEIQGAQFAHAVGLTEVWRSCGVFPDLTVGHSLGEVAAAYVAGTISLPDAAAVVAARAGAVARLPGRYAAAALGLTEQAARDAIERATGWLELSLVNSVSTVVVSGDRDAVLTLVDAVRADGTFAREIAVTFPAHTSLLESLRGELLARLPDSQFADTSVQFIGGTNGGLVAADTAFGDYWYANLRRTVRFDRALESAMGCGATSFIEMSTPPVLLFAMSQHFESATGLTDRPAVLVGSGRKGEPLLDALSASVLTAAVADPGYAWNELIDDDALGSPGLRGFPNAPMRAVPMWAHPEPLPRPSGPGVTIAHERWETMVPARGPGRRRVAVIGLGGGILDRSLRAAIDLHPATELTTAREAQLVMVVAPPFDCVAPDRAPAALAGLIDAGLLDYPAQVGPHCHTVCLVTVGAEQLDPADPAPAACHAGLSAMHRSIGFEHPDRAFSHLDLPSWELGPAAAAAALDTALTGATEAALRYRDSGYVTLVRAVADIPAGREWSLHTGVLDEVVITGGGGMIGMYYARYLAERGARRIVLLSRRGADPAALATLSARCRTVMLAPPCDITDPAQLADVASEYGAAGASLVIHAAGAASFEEAATTSSDALTRACAAKVVGLARISELWPLRPDARMLLCSSVSGVWGGRTHVAYSAANRLLDVLAARLRARGTRCTSVKYGLWQSVSESNRGIVGAAGIGQIERSGLRPMAPQRAIEASLCDYGIDPLIFAADPARFRIFLGGAQPPAAEPTDQGYGSVAVADTVRGELAAVLGIRPAEAVSLQESLFDLGVDSLLAVDLRSRLKRVLGRTVPLSLLLDQITGDGIVAILESADGHRTAAEKAEISRD